MSLATSTRGIDRADREVRIAWMFFSGTVVALIVNGIWTMIVGTASPGGDEKDLVQGWEGVMRNLPGYLLVVVVASLGVWFAIRAGIHGSERARTALVATCLMLLFGLSAVTRDSAEVVMTTRAATVSWLTFGADAIIVGVIFLFAQRTINRASGQ